MYPVTKEFMDAELAYRREQLIAARPAKREWRRRSLRSTRSRAGALRGESAAAA